MFPRHLATDVHGDWRGWTTLTNLRACWRATPFGRRKSTEIESDHCHLRVFADARSNSHPGDVNMSMTPGGTNGMAQDVSESQGVADELEVPHFGSRRSGSSQILFTKTRFSCKFCAARACLRTIAMRNRMLENPMVISGGWSRESRVHPLFCESRLPRRLIGSWVRPWPDYWELGKPEGLRPLKGTIVLF